jgi:small subunit ribosomal protein S18
MARSNDRERKRAPKDDRRRGGKKKVCIFCKEHIDWVDYKDVNLLRRFMSDRGKIRARRVSGNCAQHQRDVATAVKLGRELALLPYLQRTTTERGGGRGSRPPRGEPRAEALPEAPVDDVYEADVDLDVEGVDTGVDAVETADVVDGADATEAADAVEVEPTEETGPEEEA